MLKNNKKLLVWSTLVLLLPMLLGLILWNRLPDEIAIHFNAAGDADNFAGKTFTVFAIPGIMLAVHLLALVMTSVDPKHKNIDGKPLTLIFWLCPVLNLLLSSVVYANALNIGLNVGLVMMLVLGVMFIIIGNYLPKCKQNFSFGIKIPWTLNDEENWNHTHRFTGRLWTLCGALMVLLAFTGNIWICMGILFVMVIPPMIYSYLYYKKHSAE